MTNAEAVSLGQKVFTPNYKQQPVVLTRGQGVFAWDGDGKRYLDMIAGIASLPLGHCHPAIVAALRAQADLLWHTANTFFNPRALELSERLCALSFGKRVFLANSGTEANEAALKVARRYHYQRGDKERVEIVSLEGSFHGRSLGALAATAQPKYHEGIGPLPPGFRYIPAGDLDALTAALTPKTAAVIAETVQGEGGVRPLPRGYFAKLRELCDRAGVLWIDDEVQAGVARSGALFGYQLEGVTPDVMTLAKGLGNGIPIGAMVATEAVGASLGPGTHASTFGGNPLACACALAVLDIVVQDRLWEQSAQSGEYLRGRLSEAKRRGAGEIREVRGRGLWVGVEVEDAPGVVNRCRELGMLVNLAGEKTVRLAPSLLIEHAHLDEATAIFERAVAKPEVMG
jgi:acetylornithine/N-succinyldiaminopimelate aminotransferase